MSAWSDIWDVIVAAANVDAGNAAGAGNAIAPAAVGAGQAAASGTGFFGSLTAFLIAMTDWHMWASLGWLVLGVVLIVVGLLLWLRHGQVLPDAVPVPVPV